MRDIATCVQASFNSLQKTNLLTFFPGLLVVQLLVANFYPVKDLVKRNILDITKPRLKVHSSICISSQFFTLAGNTPYSMSITKPPLPSTNRLVTLSKQVLAQLHCFLIQNHTSYWYPIYSLFKPKCTTLSRIALLPSPMHSLWVMIHAHVQCLFLKIKQLLSVLLYITNGILLLIPYLEAIPASKWFSSSKLSFHQMSTLFAYIYHLYLHLSKPC